MPMELLAERAKSSFGLDLNADQLAAFQIYYTELADWNERVNLTAIISYEDVQVRHFLDSLALANPQLRGDPPQSKFNLSQMAVIDIGAGAGFPGLPLKIIFPGMRLTLADSVGKKTNFLSHLIGKLELEQVTVLTGRAEDLGQQAAHRERYDLVTSRAVAALPTLAEYCLPLCKVGGLFIAPKKGDLNEELASAQAAIVKLGGKLRQTPTFELEPEVAEARLLVVADKVAATPPGYPRRAGLPAKRPLTA